MAINRHPENRVRQRALSDKLDPELVLEIRFECTVGFCKGALGVPVVYLHHVVTVACGTQDLCTLHVGMMFAAESNRITVVHRVESAVEVDCTANEMHQGIRTFVERELASQIEFFVEPLALVRITLALAWGRSSSGQGSQGGQDGK